LGSRDHIAKRFCRCCERPRPSPRYIDTSQNVLKAATSHMHPFTATWRERSRPHAFRQICEALDEDRVWARSCDVMSPAAFARLLWSSKCNEGPVKHCTYLCPMGCLDMRRLGEADCVLDRTGPVHRRSGGDLNAEFTSAATTSSRSPHNIQSRCRCARLSRKGSPAADHGCC
jgi:hypothetical protein